MTIHDAIGFARIRLERAGLDAGDAAFDAQLLARHALGGWDPGRLITHWRSTAPPGFADAYEALVARREKREPAAYIMGSREFWALDIGVGPGVLIPRPETELIVEEVLNRSKGPSRGKSPASPQGPSPSPGGALQVADLGTGSGCLAVALARSLPQARVVATDISDTALAIALRNVDQHGVGNRITLVHADIFDAGATPIEPVRRGLDSGEASDAGFLPSTSLGATPSTLSLRRSRGHPETVGGSKGRIPALFDVIVSNPPYVPSDDIAGLQPEVRDYEPRGALDGGIDGLDFIRRLVPEAAGRLAPGGLFLFEFGFGQEDGVRGIVAAEPRLALVDIRRDVAGIPRVAVTRGASARSHEKSSSQPLKDRHHDH